MDVCVCVPASEKKWKREKESVYLNRCIIKLIMRERKKQRERVRRWMIKEWQNRKTVKDNGQVERKKRKNRGEADVFNCPLKDYFVTDIYRCIYTWKKKNSKGSRQKNKESPTVDGDKKSRLTQKTLDWKALLLCSLVSKIVLFIWIFLFSARFVSFSSWSGLHRCISTNEDWLQT